MNQVRSSAVALALGQDQRGENGNGQLPARYIQPQMQPATDVHRLATQPLQQPPGVPVPAAAPRRPVTDPLGAGPGEMVLICQGSSARLTPETEKLPTQRPDLQSDQGSS